MSQFVERYSRQLGSQLQPFMNGTFQASVRFPNGHKGTLLVFTHQAAVSIAASARSVGVSTFGITEVDRQTPVDITTKNVFGKPGPYKFLFDGVATRTQQAARIALPEHPDPDMTVEENGWGSPAIHLQTYGPTALLIEGATVDEAAPAVAMVDHDDPRTYFLANNEVLTGRQLPSLTGEADAFDTKIIDAEHPKVDTRLVTVAPGVHLGVDQSDVPASVRAEAGELHLYERANQGINPSNAWILKPPPRGERDSQRGSLGLNRGAQTRLVNPTDETAIVRVSGVTMRPLKDPITHDYF